METALLITNYLKGNKPATEELCTYITTILRIHNLKFYKNQSDAQDATQNQLLLILKAITDGKYTETNQFKAWISRFASNFNRMVYRKNSKTPQTLHLNDFPEDQFPEATTELFEESSINNNRLNALKSAIAKLTLRDQSIIKRVLLGDKNPQLAKVFHCSLSSISSTVSKIYKKLRIILSRIK